MKDTLYQKINNICLIILAAATIMAVLIYTKTVLIPLVVSLFIYAMMIPTKRFLQKKTKMPGLLASIITFTAFLGLIFLIVLRARWLKNMQSKSKFKIVMTPRGYSFKRDFLYQSCVVSSCYTV